MNIIIGYQWYTLLVLSLFMMFTIFDNSFSIDESEFDVNQDFSIDSPNVNGMDDIMKENFNEQTSSAPQPQNEVRDISGWGIIGKIHPKILVKDRLIKAYHNRPLDPRYLHLQNYGQQQSHNGKSSQNENEINKLFKI